MFQSEFFIFTSHQLFLPVPLCLLSSKSWSSLNISSIIHILLKISANFKACQFFLKDLLNWLPCRSSYCNLIGTDPHRLNNSFLNDWGRKLDDAINPGTRIPLNDQQGFSVTYCLLHFLCPGYLKSFINALHHALSHLWISPYSSSFSWSTLLSHLFFFFFFFFFGLIKKNISISYS